mmetsp:Transcript_24183/g.47214  ORF Transcript_24183/g.47214 Transcript_24183/m.47214 type:complete len:140 (-) Transcript_24183:988-1407(-)
MTLLTLNLPPIEPQHAQCEDPTARSYTHTLRIQGRTGTHSAQCTPTATLITLLLQHTHNAHPTSPPPPPQHSRIHLRITSVYYPNNTTRPLSPKTFNPHPKLPTGNLSTNAQWHTTTHKTHTHTDTPTHDTPHMCAHAT